MNIAIVNKSNYSIEYTYVASASNQQGFGGDWGNPIKFSHVEIPSNLVPSKVIAQSDGDGGIEFAENSTKVTSFRNGVLDRLRSARAVKFTEADAAIFKHYDGDSSAVGTEAAWKTYRIALRNVTDSYKTDGAPNSSCDSLNVSSFVWPTQPTE